MNMRKSILSLAVVALLASCGGAESTESSATTQSTSESFKVYGNCGMCEKTIEGSLKDIDGVSKADWNKETKQMEVEFDASKIKLAEIKLKIAGVGYDMEDVRAEESTYNGLPGCCQYQRPDSEEKKDMNKEHPMDSTHDHGNHEHHNH